MRASNQEKVASALITLGATHIGFLPASPYGKRAWDVYTHPSLRGYLYLRSRGSHQQGSALRYGHTGNPNLAKLESQAKFALMAFANDDHPLNPEHTSKLIRVLAKAEVNMLWWKTYMLAGV